LIQKETEDIRSLVIFSDRKFTIVNKTNEVCSSNDPCLEIISPNNGEAYNVGDIVKIKWKTKNIRKDADTLLAIMDDRIPGWQANSLFGSSPALEYTEMTELSKDEYLYEYTFTVPENFNTSLPDKYQDVYGGKHYDAEVYVTFSGKSGTKSQKTIMDKSDKLFTINTKSASSLSEEQVSNLSKQSGLNISNICRNVSFPITEKTQIGSKGNSVSFLQLLLIQKKYLPHDLHTTYFGPRTKMALETFQKDSKIEVSGVVDKKTKDALQVLVSSYCSQAFGVTSKTQ
jgi:hypothetical protein